jgi:hypothetical protein
VLGISDSYWKCVTFNDDLKVEHISRNLCLITYQSMYTFRHTKSEQIWYTLFSTISVKVHQSTRCVILQVVFVVVRFGILQMKRKICITWVNIRYLRRTLPMDIVTLQGNQHISTVEWSFCPLTIETSVLILTDTSTNVCMSSWVLAYEIFFHLFPKL